MEKRKLYRLQRPVAGYRPGTFFIADDDDYVLEVELVPGHRPGKWKVAHKSSILVPKETIADHCIEVPL